MSGRPGRGGHNRLTPEAHVLRGTFNPARHTALIPPGPPWNPDPAQLAALGAAGQAWIGRIRAAYALGVLEGELALEGAIALDRLAEIRKARGRRNLSDDDRRGLDRLELAWQRAWTACVLALRPRMAPATAAQDESKWAAVL